MPTNSAWLAMAAVRQCAFDATYFSCSTLFAVIEHCDIGVSFFCSFPSFLFGPTSPKVFRLCRVPSSYGIAAAAAAVAVDVKSTRSNSLGQTFTVRRRRLVAGGEDENTGEVEKTYEANLLMH